MSGPECWSPCPQCKGTGLTLDWTVVGPMVRAAREKRGLTLRDLARTVYCSHTYLSMLERGKHPGAGPGPAALAVLRELDLLDVLVQPTSQPSGVTE